MTERATDLTAFLHARLDEDEAMVAVPHIWPTTFQPARALREVEAKRAILEMYASTLALVEHPPVMPEDHPHAGKISARDYMDAKRELAVLKPAVVALAAIYSDHPDYDPEWEPTS